MRKKVVLSLLCVPNTTDALWNSFLVAAIAQGWTVPETTEVWKQVFEAPDYLAALEIIFDHSDTCAEGDDDYYNDGPGEKEDIYDRVL